MLKKVSQTALVVILENRAYFLGDVEIGLPLGGLVVADVIGEAVGKHALAHHSVGRQGRHLRHTLGLGRYGDGEHPYHQEQHLRKDFFHIRVEYSW